MLFQNRPSSARPAPSVNSLNQLYLLEGMNFGHSDRQVDLHEINLVINRGEMLFLTGPAGSGKTTLLKLLAGLHRPQTGRVIGPTLQESDPSLAVSMIFQDLFLLDDWSVEENLMVSYHAKIHGGRKAFLQEMVDMAELLGIRDKLQVAAKTLSGGMKQKLAILRALLGHPMILLADEPTSALDRTSALKVYEIFTYYNQKYRTTVIWATHDKEFIRKFSGRIIHIENGKLIYVGYACFM